MHVDEFGPKDAVPIVFLHGSMVAGWMWMGQVEDLPEYRCLIPDFPGFNQSADEEWISFGDTADCVADMIKRRCIDGTANIVGLSLGGIIGLYVAVRHPETVRSLIISGVPHGTVPPLLRAFSRAMLWLYQRTWGARFIARIFGIPQDESMDAFLDTASARRAVSYLDEVIPGAAGNTVPEVGHQWNAEKHDLFSDMVRAWIESGSVDERLLPVDRT
jgi:pimeloyl-ACP methyl ester carboxylesterase